MNTSIINIDLIRGDVVHNASVSLVQGDLNNLKHSLDLLHPKELAYFNKLKYERRKVSYLLGRYSSKLAVLSLTNGTVPSDIWTDSGVFFFPIVICKKLENVQVSISHSENVGVSIAFPECHPLGIDVETINPNRESVFKSQLTNNEIIKLAKLGASKIEFYTAIWCAKEALSKIIKTGMMLDFDLLELDEIQIDEFVLKSTFVNFKQYKSVTYITPSFALSFVLPKKTFATLDVVHDVFSEFRSSTQLVKAI